MNAKTALTGSRILAGLCLAWCLGWMIWEITRNTATGYIFTVVFFILALINLASLLNFWSWVGRRGRRKEDEEWLDFLDSLDQGGR